MTSSDTLKKETIGFAAIKRTIPINKEISTDILDIFFDDSIATSSLLAPISFPTTTTVA